MPSAWLLLLYKVPSRPTARRVYVWRKLKRLGAMRLQGAVWVLPDTPRTREQFQWLAAEIGELRGEALLWQGQPLLGGQDEALVGLFTRQVDEAYAQILSKLERKAPNLERLARRYQQVSAEDYFHSELGEQVRQALLSARGGPQS